MVECKKKQKEPVNFKTERFCTTKCLHKGFLFSSVDIHCSLTSAAPAGLFLYVQNNVDLCD